MRKFIGVFLYIFAGIFIGTLVVIAAGNYGLSEDYRFLTGVIIAVIGLVFLLLAAWIHPSKAWKKHMAITIAASTVLMFLGNVNQYFIIKGMRNADINTTYANVLKEVSFTYDWSASIIVTLVLFGIAFLLYTEKGKK